MKITKNIIEHQMKQNHLSLSRRYKALRIVGIIMSFIAGVIWFATIVVLFIQWGLDGFVSYDSDDGQVIYISNACSKRRRGCILGTVTTGIPYVLAILFTKLFYDPFIQQRFRRLVSLLALICALIASIFLILLSIFDSVRYKRAHYIFVGLFFVFAVLCAVLYVLYRFYSNQNNWILSIYSFVIGLLIPLAISFIVIGLIGGRGPRSNLKSVAASLEWSIALIFVLYFISFAFDLLLFKK